jgi:ABC-type bacteriocin/lantibiotic exporter with double-glycine peptidase domain
MKSENSSQTFKKANEKYNSIQISQRKKLLLLIWNTIWIPYCCSFLEIVADIIQIFVQPLLLGKLMDFVSKDTLVSNEEHLWQGMVYAVFYSLAALTSRTLEAHVEVFLYIASNRAKIALQSNIYEKVLKLSPSAKREYTSGKSINRQIS